MALRGLGNNERAALLIGECQRGATDTSVAGPGGLAGQVEERGIMGRIAALAKTCRGRGIPVVHAIKVARPDAGGTFANSVLAATSRKSRLGPDREIRTAIHPELTVDPSDIVVSRLHGLSCFHDSALEPVLRSYHVETIILVGVSTNINLWGTSLEAVNRGFTVVLPEDCTAGATPESHAFFINETLRLLTTVTTYSDVCAALEGR